MNRIYIFFMLIAFSVAFSQKKPINKNEDVITAEYAEMSNDQQVIATFIKANPEHPKTPALRSKLLTLIGVPKNDAEAKPRVQPLTAGKVVKEARKEARRGTSAEANQAAKVLTHLFNNDPNKREAYVEIMNRSKCNIIVKFSGRKFYNLNVNANTKNYILVDKGSYTLTTDVCNAKYSSSKNIMRDITLTLR